MRAAPSSFRERQVQKLFDRLRPPRIRTGRTHGGFGFAPPPLISRTHATYAALSIGMLALVVAGAAALGPSNTDDAPTRLALAPDEPFAVAPETQPAPAPADMPPAASAIPVTEQVNAAPEPLQPSAAATVRAAPPTLADAQAMQGQAQPAAPILSFQSPYEGMAPVAAEADTTAAIEDEPASDETVPVAESEAETAQLEAQQQEQTVIQEENGNAFNSPIMGDARANQHVNLRAGPSDGARVLMVVPANARIQAAKDCAYWCEVVYEGRRGFIYKSFIARSD